MIVYIAQNRINDKVYIGKTEATLEERWRLHLVAVKQNSQYAFHRAIKKYGSDAFLVCPISSASSAEELAQIEVFYIAKFHSTENAHGYNMTAGGEPGWSYVNKRNKTNHPKGMLNKKHSAATRKQMRESHADISGDKHPMYGKHHTEASKAKTAASMRLARQKKNWSTRKSTIQSNIEAQLHGI